MVRGVELDERAIGPKHICIEKAVFRTRLAANITDVGQRREELRTRLELFRVCRLHVLCTPAKVPDCRRKLRRWCFIDFREQHPRLLRPHTIHEPGKPGFFRIELRGVELDRGLRINRIQMQMVKVCILDDGLRCSRGCGRCLLR